MLDIELYKEHLNSKNFGELLYFDELDSTNSAALKLSTEDQNGGTVVLTENQKSGRGRQGNKWFSIPGKSLTFSIILYPNCPIGLINRYSLITGLAVADTLKDYKLVPRLKWPNDLLINNKKICGILCESKIQGDQVKTMVIGIGININLDASDFPLTLKGSATSIKIEQGQKYRIELVLATIINNLKSRIDQIGNFEIQLNDWISDCSHLNSKISFQIGEKIINGIFTGLTTSGQAIIRVNNKDMFFDSGAVIY